MGHEQMMRVPLDHQHIIKYVQVKNLCLLFFSIANLCAIYAQKNVARNLDSLFNVLHKQEQFNGNVLIANKGKIIYEKSFGYADMDQKRELSPSSVFDIGPVSKQFTSMAIMILYDRHKLTFDDNIRTYLREIPYTNITIRHLLTHTSGIPEHFRHSAKWGEGWDTVIIKNNNKLLIELVKRKPTLNFKPGERWEYCNDNYALLALIVERVSGKKFRDFLKKEIFDPLQMNNTSSFTRFDQIKPKELAVGYEYSFQRGKYISGDEISDFYFTLSKDGVEGDGNIKSTTGDLLKWDRALYVEKLIKNSTLDEAFSPVKLTNGQTVNYGFGWFIDYNEASENEIKQNGGTPGHFTYIGRYVGIYKTVIFQKNINAYGFAGTMKAIENILSHKPFIIPKMSIAEVIRKMDLDASHFDSLKKKCAELKNDSAHYYYNENEFLKTCRSLVINNNFAGADSLFKIITAYNPGSAYANNYMGDVFMENNIYERAIAYYKRTLQLDLAFSSAAENLKRVQEKIKQ